MQRNAKNIIDEVRKAVVGKDEIIEKILMVILARGHILLEDIPGVGKTTMALAFSKAMQLECKRIQFTSDVMPSDVVGFSVYDKSSGTLRYKAGAALCNLFLADEINRTSSKTQSALLQVMEEGRITIDGITHETPKPFTVIATQNPVGSAGTQLLPESQLDRFMVRLTMGYPELSEEVEILKRKQGQDPLEQVMPAADAPLIIAMQNKTEEIYLSDAVYDYVARLTAATRSHPMIRLGASPRASIALTKMARAAAFLKERDYVIPEDVQLVFQDVIKHRIVLSPQARIAGKTVEEILTEIAASVQVPTI